MSEKFRELRNSRLFSSETLFSRRAMSINQNLMLLRAEAVFARSSAASEILQTEVAQCARDTSQT